MIHEKGQFEIGVPVRYDLDAERMESLRIRYRVTEPQSW
jgi:hypothetical protein